MRCGTPDLEMLQVLQMERAMVIEMGQNLLREEEYEMMPELHEELEAIDQKITEIIER